MELLAALFSASQSNDAGMRECAFRIFSTTPGIIEKQHESAVQDVFGKGFKDSSVEVRKCAQDHVVLFTDCPLGSARSHRSLRIVFPLHYQESSTEILFFDPRHP